MKKLIDQITKRRLSEKDIFGEPDFRMAGKRIRVAEPTAQRYVDALKVLGNYSQSAPPSGADSIERYALSVLESAHAEDFALETKLRELVLNKSESLLELYRAVFVLDEVSVTLSDVLNEPLWQLKLGVSIFFWRHKNHARGSGSGF